MNNFRSLLLEIGRHMTLADLGNLKFACGIPSGRAEFIEQPHDLFLEMERLNRLSEENPKDLADLLEKIGRNDLKRKLLKQEEEVVPFDWKERQPLSAKNAKANVTDEMILALKLPEKISTNWKMVGRYLKLEEYVLRNIESDYRRTDERSNEMIQSWFRQGKSKTTAEFLIQALKHAGRTDLAEEVEDYYEKKFPSVQELSDNLPDGPPRVALQHEHNQPGQNQPGPSQPGPLQPGPSQPGPSQPGPSQPGISQPGISQPGISQPGPSQPGPSQPGPSQPAEDETDRVPQENDGDKLPTQVSEGEGENLETFKDQKAYTILDLIGTGGFSKVYCVMENKTKKKFAAKVVDLGMNDTLTQKKVKALEKDIALMKSLQNDYIVAYHKTETFKDKFVLCMEYMPGGSISDKLGKDGKIPENIVRKYTWQMLIGIQYLHENKIIHRDIKGANVLLDSEHNIVKLTDFGVSLSLEGIVTSTGHCVSNRDGMCGSIFWTSPELLCSEKYSRNTDIWSLGCTVIEMLTGNPPFRNIGLQVPQILFRISQSDIKIPEECSSLAKEFLDQCFRKRDERPSASQLLDTEHYLFPVRCI